MSTEEEAEQTGRDGKTDCDNDEDSRNGFPRELALSHRGEPRPPLDRIPEQAWMRAAAPLG
jgi:hypothetical protein